MGLILSIENTIAAYNAPNAPNGLDADYQAVLDYAADTRLYFTKCITTSITKSVSS
jgi:hypothetical protein